MCYVVSVVCEGHTEFGWDGSTDDISKNHTGRECPGYLWDAITCAGSANTSQAPSLTNLSPSWCASSQPFIVPRPPSALVNSSADQTQVPYFCGGDGDKDDIFASCQLTVHFQAVELPTVNNQTERVIVYVARETADSVTNSTVTLLDTRLNVLAKPVPQGIPGDASLLVTLPSRRDPNSLMIAYGGYVPPGLPIPGLPPHYCDHGGCALASFVEFNLVNTGGEFNEETFIGAGQVLVSGVQLGDSTFFYKGDSMGYAAVARNTTAASWFFVFWELTTCRDYPGEPPYDCFMHNQTWELKRDGKPIPADAHIQIDVVEHYDDCSVTGPNLQYAFGSFFNRTQCRERTLLGLSEAGSLSLFMYESYHGTNTPYELTHVMDLDRDVLTAVYVAPPMHIITDFGLFTQQVPAAKYITQPLPANLTADDDGGGGGSSTAVAVADSTGGDLPPTAQILYAAIAVRDTVSGEDALHIIDFPEFATHPTSNSSNITNPAGVPSSGQPVCSPNDYYNIGAGTCIPHPIQTVANGEDVPDGIDRVQIRWRGIPTQLEQQYMSANCTPTDVACMEAAMERALSQGAAASSQLTPLLQLLLDNGSGNATDMVQDFIGSSYGLNWVVFVSAHNSSIVPVFHVKGIPHSCSAQHGVDGSTVIGSVANRLTMMGPVTATWPTQNGQYLFAAITRARYALQSMNRLVEVCEKLEAEPSNPFLANWTVACNSDPAPRRPVVADFLQTATACLPGTYCPSFLTETIEVMPNGNYSLYGFDQAPCEPGFTCREGQRTPCPTGFMCPDFGMSLPIQCPYDNQLLLSCSSPGHIAPSPAPNGTLAGVPYLPPLPAPPGFAQDVLPITEVRSLTVCTDGEWCNLGSSTANLTLLECPAYFSCSSPSVITPNQCTDNGTCTTSGCPEGHMPHCPAGTVEEHLCPAGKFCPRPASSVVCSLGSYCPEGSPVWQICPAGRYCPTPADLKECPHGHYCPEGTVDPVPCSFLARCECPHGCKEQSNFEAIPILLAIPVVFALLYHVGTKMMASRGKKRDKLVERHTKRPFRIELSTDGITTPLVGDSDKEDGFGEERKEDDHRRQRQPQPQPQPQLHPPPSSQDFVTTAGKCLQPKTERINFEFRDLGLRIKSGKVVLSKVSGRISGGRLTAVMGPSGCGKSTFMSTLAGKATYGEQLGQILINGQEMSLHQFKALTGHVPQEDIMVRNCTVDENLRFAAHARLPRNWAEWKRLQLVYETIEYLGLTRIRHSLIGDERVRGISGGQRKRVNVGLEMVADPTVLMLDEPTSGLDSTSALELCQTLQRVARLGLTVVAVIHQPRYDVFQLFDDVVLLGVGPKGGRSVYIGPTAKVEDYFAFHGFHAPRAVNPADFFLDVIGGMVPAEFMEQHPGWKAVNLFPMWDEFVKRRDAALAPHRTLPPSSSSSASSGSGAGYGAGSAADQQAALVRLAPEPPPPDTVLPNPKRQSATFWSLLVLVLKRALIRHSRSKLAFLIDNLLVFSAALGLSLVYLGDPAYTAPLPLEVFQGCPAEVGSECQVCLSSVQDQISARSIMTSIAIGLTGVASMIRVFSDRLVFWREASGLPQPTHTLAYFIGNDLSMLPQQIVGPFVYAITYASISNPRSSFADFYLILFMSYFCATGLAYVVSIITPAELSQLCGAVVVFGFSLFSGSAPTLPQLYDKFFPLSFVPRVSYMRYVQEALYVSEVKAYTRVNAVQHVDLARHVKNVFDFGLDSLDRNLRIIFMFGIVFRVIACVALWAKDRAKKV